MLHSHVAVDDSFIVVVSPDADSEAIDLVKKTETGNWLDSFPDAGEYLYIDQEGVSLCRVGEKGRVRVDFVGGAAKHRRTQGGGELIAKAVDAKKNSTVWDATGGLGRDAFVMATLGLNVTISERHPAVACLLADGIRRATADPEAAAVAQRMNLVMGDSIQLLNTAKSVDVVYLDPMYPERKKNAAVKKEMAYFHHLVGAADESDDLALLIAARHVANKRVVVKRPRLGVFLAGIEPDYQYTGKSTRFDIYRPNQ